MNTFYFEQSENTIAVHLKADTSVNAWSGVVEVADTHAIVNIVTKDNAGEIWRTSPSIEAGRGIVFSGGIPNGFVGDTVLFRFSLQNVVPTLSFSTDTALYLSDGKGTEVSVIVSPFVPNANVAYSSARIIKDITPPEPFTPELYRDATAFGSMPVAIFSAHDNDSGIQKYEVREITAYGDGVWQSGESPYVINPDVVALEIRAYDNMGNVRTEELLVSPKTSNVSMYITLIGAFALLFVVYTIKRWRKNS